MCVVCSVCLGRITKHKTIFNLILSVEFYSWSQDKSLGKKLTGHFGSQEYKTLNPIPAGSELYLRVLSQLFCLSPSGGCQVVEGGKPLISKCWGRKWWPVIKNELILPIHLTSWGGLERKAGLEICFPPKLREYSQEMQARQQVFLGVLMSTIHEEVSFPTAETRSPPCTWSIGLAL